MTPLFVWKGVVVSMEPESMRLTYLMRLRESRIPEWGKVRGFCEGRTRFPARKKRAGKAAISLLA